MKRIIISIILLLSLSQLALCQTKEITLKVIGEGTDKNEAIQNGLRHAVEQVYGTFVSTNTTIINDDLVKDEIATISSGNIKKYQELASIVLPSGVTSVELEVVVSVGKLISYAKNHGVSCDLSGSTFSANKRLYDMNVKNAKRTMNHLVDVLKNCANSIFDYDFSVSNPYNNIFGQNEVRMDINIKSNENTKNLCDYIFNTLYSITCSKEESKLYRNAGFTMYKYMIGPSNKFAFQIALASNEIQERWSYIRIDDKELNRIFLEAINNFIVTDNLENEYKFDQINEKCIIAGLDETLLGNKFNYFEVQLDYKPGQTVFHNSKTFELSDIDQISSLEITPKEPSGELSLPSMGNNRNNILKTTYFIHYNHNLSVGNKQQDQSLVRAGNNCGIMLGMCKKIGGYAKLNFGLDYEYGYGDSNKAITKTSGCYVGAGLMFRPFYCFYPYVGIGYSNINADTYVSWFEGFTGPISQATYSDPEIIASTNTNPGIGFEVGVMLRLTFVSLSVGYSYMPIGSFCNLGIGLAL